MSSTTAQIITTSPVTLKIATSSPYLLSKAENDAYWAPIDAQYSQADDPDNQYDPWQIHPVDLLAFEAGITKGRPVYTRKLLQRLAHVRDRILTDKSFRYCYESDVRTGEQRCIWQRSSPDDDWVEMNYLSAVEMHPDMHVEKQRSPIVHCLHDMNVVEQELKKDEEELILCPVVITSERKADSRIRLLRQGQEDHLDVELMEWWRTQMATIRRKLRSSETARFLRNGFLSTRDQRVQIRKIVCFGLGRMQQQKNDYQEVLQHLTAFGIASVLNAAYRSQDASAESIKIVLQDPLYTEKDKILLREEYSEGEVKFVADPDGFVEVDGHTLVIAPFINIDCPVLQICADLCRPAGFICDRMDLDIQQSHYEWNNRSSPRVAQMLKDYKHVTFDNVRVEEDMFEEYCAGRMYWLWGMNMWLRPKQE